MYVFLSILIFIASVFLILIVLVQNSKGGGLASGFSSSNQIMGVRKTTDFLEKSDMGIGRHSRCLEYSHYFVHSSW